MDLALVMIVKNEAHGIARTLASVKGIVDTWTIIDTGSTDETPAIVERELAGVPGELVRAPFTNFAETRNAALEQLGRRARFALLLDADDELEGPIALRAFVANANEGEGTFYVRVHQGGASFLSRRLMATSSGARYVGAVHEVLVGDPKSTVPGVRIARRPPAASLEATRARWTRDIEVLSAALERDASDARSAFYLAMTFHWLGELERAEAMFLRRLELGGWWEELYESMMRLGALHEATRAGGDLPTALDWYARAAELAPHRAEPLLAIAELERRRERWASSYVHARRARELLAPERDRLFVDDSAYTWRAPDLVAIAIYYLVRVLERGQGHTGELARLRAEGAAAARRALELGPPEHRARMAANAAFYVAMLRPPPASSPAPAPTSSG